MVRFALITCLALMSLEVVTPQFAWGQEFDWSGKDLPELVEELRYGETDSEVPNTSEDFPTAEEPDQSTESTDSPSNKPQSIQNFNSNSQAQSAVQSSGNCIKCRDTFFDDCLGVRSCLKENGIIYRGRLTQFFMGVAGGVQAPVAPPLATLGIAPGDRFDYTGTSRHDFIVALDKYGCRDDSKLLVTMENIWGRFGNVGLSTGGVGAVFGALLPVDFEADGVPRMTNFFYMQPVSDQLLVGVGKRRMPGIADQDIFAGGDGTDQFLNQAIASNPMFLAFLPVTGFVTMAVMPQDWGSVSFLAMDPNDRSTDYFDFESLFSEGVILLSEVKRTTDYFQKPGQLHVGGIWKNADLADLQFTTVPPDPPYPPTPPALATKPNTWMLYTGFDQYLRVYGNPAKAKNPQGWGLFGRAGIADGGTGNPSFAAWFTQIGIGGDSPLRQRRAKGDRFGLGYIYTATSTEWGPIPTALFEPRDSQVIEAFYRYHWTPSIHLSPDIQWVRGPLGGLTDGDDALVYGFRMNILL